MLIVCVCHICVTVRDSFSLFSYVLLMKFSYLKIDHVCLLYGRIANASYKPPSKLSSKGFPEELLEVLYCTFAHS